MPQIIRLTYKPIELEHRPADRFSRIAIEQAMLIPGHGIAGDRKGRSDSRQLNVMLAEEVERLRGEGFRTAAGELGEQIVIAGLSPDSVLPEIRLRLGESAIIELVYLRVPCGRFARIMGQSKELVRGRLGYMARVLTAGEVKIGSPVLIVHHGRVIDIHDPIIHSGEVSHGEAE